MNIDIDKLEALLNEQKFDEAKKVLEKAFKSKLTPEEKAALLFNLRAIELDVMNKMDEQYVTALKAHLSNLKAVHEKGKSANEQIDLARVRAELS
jgi:hypothetical protein